MVNHTSNNYSALAQTSASQVEQPAAPNQLEESIRKKICSWDQCHRENPKMICSRCKLVNYCDTVCQKSDWAFHKTICKAPEKANKIQRTGQHSLPKIELGTDPGFFGTGAYFSANGRLDFLYSSYY